MGVGWELERGIKPRKEFDVKLLNYSPIEFQYEVLKKGVVVFSRDERTRVDYETDVLLEYLDIREMLEQMDYEFLVRA